MIKNNQTPYFGHSEYTFQSHKRHGEFELEGQPEQKKRKTDPQNGDLERILQKIDLFCYETIEGLNEVSAPEPLSTESVSNSETPLFNINTLTATELSLFFQNNPPLTALERFQSLSDLFTPVPSCGPNGKGYKEMWLKISKGHFSHEQQKCWLSLMIVEDLYNSQCFAEKELNFDIPNLSYFYINASLENNDEKLCFQIRLDPWISTSEILHIEKIPELSGTHVKSLCMSIINYLNPAYVYINDDSKITSVPNKTLDLRVLLPIVSKEPKTWYTSDDFTLLPFSQLESPSSTLLESQNESDYVKAIDKIRNTPLSCLSHAKLSIWKRRYIEPNCKKTLTLHSLGKVMYERSRNHDKTVNIATQQLANQDLSEFYTAFLTERDLHQKDYRIALAILYDYKIWYRHNPREGY